MRPKPATEALCVPIWEHLPSAGGEGLVSMGVISAQLCLWCADLSSTPQAELGSCHLRYTHLGVLHPTQLVAQFYIPTWSLWAEGV